MTENHSVLGGYSAGALRLGRGARTLFSEFSGSWRPRTDLTISVRAGGGHTKVTGDAGSLVNSITSIVTSHFSARLEKTAVVRPSDSFFVAVAQPLRVEAGVIGLAVPSGRDYDEDRLLFTETGGRLVPTAREIDFEIGYRTRALGLIWSGNILRRRNPGHSQQRKAETAALISLYRPF